MEIRNLDGWKRTHSCGDLRAGDIGREVCLAGWVHRVRDHGGVFFLDLRDRGGLTQILCRPGTVSEEVLEIARSVRPEFVLAVRGEVSPRPDEMRNPNMPTGDVEVVASEMKVLNESDVPPFVIGDATRAGEDLRLEYRYLDLRSPVAAIRDGPPAPRGAGDPPAISTSRASGRSRPRCSCVRRRKGRATTSCRAGSIRGVSTRCRSRRSCTSRSSWSRGWTATSSSPAVCGTRICAPTASPSTRRSTSR